MGVALHESKGSSHCKLWLRGVCSILAAGMLLTGLFMSITYLKTHSYPDFECETFSQKIDVIYNFTTGQYQMGTAPQFARLVTNVRNESSTRALFYSSGANESMHYLDWIGLVGNQ